MQLNILVKNVCVVTIVVFSGNKSDKTAQREVPTHIASEFANRHRMNFLETSAKEAENVDKLFLEIASHLTELASLNKLKSDKNDSQELGESSSVTAWTSCCKLQ